MERSIIKQTEPDNRLLRVWGNAQNAEEGRAPNPTARRPGVAVTRRKGR